MLLLKNRNMGKIFINFIIWLFIWIPIQVSANSESISVKNNIRIQNLENTIKHLEEVNLRILSTVYWSIWWAFSLLVLVLWANFLQSNKVQKRDIDIHVESLKNEIWSDIEILTKDGLNKIKENSSWNINLLKEEFRTLKKSNRWELEKLETKIQDIRKSFSEEIEEINRSILLQEGLNWKQKWVPANYLRSLMEVLRSDIKKGWDFRISRTLDNIYNSITDKNFISEIQLISELTELLENVPPKYDIIKNKILKKAQEL